MRCGTYAYSLHLFMPRFGVDTKGDLVPSLRKLGMKLATEPGGAADFSGITSPSELFIAAVPPGEHRRRRDRHGGRRRDGGDHGHHGRLWRPAAGQVRHPAT
jgi:hypothetical protein